MMRASVIGGVIMVCATAVAASQEQPSVELLEFLGTWETKDGQWMDPTQFVENPDLAQVDKEETDHD